MKGAFVSFAPLKTHLEIMMSNPNIEQLTAAQKANAEVMTALMRTAFNGLERLTALNMAASREFFNTTVANAQQLLAAKDASAVAKLNSELTQPNVEKLMDYSRSIYDLVTEMQKEVTSVMEAQYSNFTQSANTAVEKAKAAAPVGGDVFAATMQSMLGASTKAFDQMTSMAKQLADIAETNIQAASKAAAPAKTSATSAAAKKTSAAK
jgi:phasin family protein